jgi:tape measure domain-containing protein
MADGTKVGDIYYGVSMDTAELIRGQRETEKAVKGTGDALKSLTPIAAAVKAALSGMAVMAVIKMADDWGQYASRMKQATNGAEEYARAQDRMLDSANKTFRSINETRESFIQLSPVLRQMGLDLDQSIDVIDTFSGLLVTNAASAERGAAAQAALAKSLQKGRIDAENWMTIYSTVDSVVDLIAASSGKAASEIRRLGADGKLGVEMLVNALSDSKDKVSQQVKEMPTTVRDAMQSIMNAMSEYVGKANDANGITAALASALTTVGNNFAILADVGLVAATAGLGRYVAGMIVAEASTAAKIVSTARAAAAEVALAQAQVAQTAATLAQTRATVGVVDSYVAAAAAAEAHAAATKRLAAAQAAQTAASATVSGALRATLALLTGPMGIALAVGAAAAAFFALRGSTNDAAKGLVDMTQPLDDIIKKFRDLNALQREKLINLQKEQVQQDAKEIQAAVYDIGAAFEPAMDKGGKAAAKARIDFGREISGLVNDASIKTDDLAGAVASLIDRWAESQRWTDRQKASMVELGARLVDLEAQGRKNADVLGLQTKAHEELAGAATRSAAALGQAAAGTAKGNEDADKQIASLQRQIALFGKAGASAGLYYDLQKGVFKDASAERQAEIKRLADDLAGLEKAQASQKQGRADTGMAAQALAARAYYEGLVSDNADALAKIDAEEQKALAENESRRVKDAANAGVYEAAKLVIAKKYADERSAYYAKTGEERAKAEESNARVTADLRIALMTNESAKVIAIRDEELRRIQTDLQMGLKTAQEAALARVQAEQQASDAIARIEGQKAGARADAKMTTLQIRAAGEGATVEDKTALIQAQAQAEMAAVDAARMADLENAQVYADQRMAIEQRMHEDIAALQQQTAASYQQGFAAMAGGLGDLTSALGNSVGEQDGLYKAMFAAQKAFSIASSIVAIQTGVAKAASEPFPANLAAMASVMSATASIISTIRGTNYGGGRQYGGPVSAGSLYRVNESGQPEMFTAANGSQYMMPTKDGNVTPANEVGGGGPAWKIIVNNAPPGTTASVDNEARIIEIAVARAEAAVANSLASNTGRVWSAARAGSNIQGRLS